MYILASGVIACTCYCKVCTILCCDCLVACVCDPVINSLCEDLASIGNYNICKCHISTCVSHRLTVSADGDSCKWLRYYRKCCSEGSYIVALSCDNHLCRCILCRNICVSCVFSLIVNTGFQCCSISHAYCHYRGDRTSGICLITDLRHNCTWYVCCSYSEGLCDSVFIIAGSLYYNVCRADIDVLLIGNCVIHTVCQKLVSKCYFHIRSELLTCVDLICDFHIGISDRSLCYSKLCTDGSLIIATSCDLCSTLAYVCVTAVAQSVISALCQNHCTKRYPDSRGKRCSLIYRIVYLNCCAWQICLCYGKLTCHAALVVGVALCWYADGRYSYIDIAAKAYVEAVHISYHHISKLYACNLRLLALSCVHKAFLIYNHTACWYVRRVDGEAYSLCLGVILCSGYDHICCSGIYIVLIC